MDVADCYGNTRLWRKISVLLDGDCSPPRGSGFLLLPHNIKNVHYAISGICLVLFGSEYTALP